jgi:hypothetical protein
MENQNWLPSHASRRSFSSPAPTVILIFWSDLLGFARIAAFLAPLNQQLATILVGLFELIRTR